MEIQHLDFPGSSAGLLVWFSAISGCRAEKWEGDRQVLAMCGAMGRAPRTFLLLVVDHSVCNSPFFIIWLYLLIF